ncbi:TIGR02530 family flagellar biosynthesis protein [Lentibacillus sp. N15]|uniref:TIGR02530 family flagellar biosynthesis protein n=1 Tax=Lentibacillus songyuanensis TaxID=3136161 RepID=UPI0031BB9725
MDHRIHQLSSQALPLSQAKKQSGLQEHISFKDVLQDVQTVKLSKHASERLNERGITINEHGWKQITAKMAEARQKGVTDSLVMIKDAALLVSTKNNTVVTAMDRKEASSKVFTNINGAIVIDE